MGSSSGGWADYWISIVDPKTVTIKETYNLQALGFSVPMVYKENQDNYTAITSLPPDKNFINVTNAYNIPDSEHDLPVTPYVNARVCYTHYQKSLEGETSSSVSTGETYDPYYVLNADRPASGICFYILYFLDCLFHHLDLVYDQTDLTSVGDLNRLCFFTTQCNYSTERKYKKDYIDNNGKEVKVYDFTNLDWINAWLRSRNTKGSLSTDKDLKKDLQSVSIQGVYYEVGAKALTPNGYLTVREIKYELFGDPTINVVANIMKMYANSNNFPSSSVSTIIDSLWASFGVKFMVDYDKKTVKARLIRNVLRDTDKPIKILCEVVSVEKISERITGFRMKYGAESDKKEKTEYIRNKVTDYDTSYDYEDYSNVDYSKTYVNIIKKIGGSDKTCYIDVNTGNQYRIKVNGDATTADELKPATFEVAQFHGVEIGDCSIENEDFIEELSSDFEPVIMNDVNGKNEKSATSGTSTIMVDETTGNQYTVSGPSAGKMRQILAAFIDEDMNHENIPFTIKNLLGSDNANFYLIENIYTDESYDPDSTEDGNSPLQHYDWGLAISIMRGGGSDAKIESYDYNYDGRKNSKWRLKAGEYQMGPDSIDNWGNDFDYNGTQPGIGDDERFSLKIRAYAPITDSEGNILCQSDRYDQSGNMVERIASRGLFDTFISEYAHFVTNRKKLGIKFKCEASELADIKWDKRYDIGGNVGWINKLNYKLSMNGIEVVTAEMFTL